MKRDVKGRGRFALLAWCLMPTRFHLVLRAAKVPHWRRPRRIQERFAADHNRRHRRPGSP